MKDEMIHLYLNNSTMALAIPREACLLGAPRCHGIGMLVGAFSICKEQEQVHEAILEERLMLTAFLLTYSEPHASEGVLGVQEGIDEYRRKLAAILYNSPCNKFWNHAQAISEEI
uniref:Uncharacterized protein n=1 Tax=Oryza barthii TaxID=65489 RepID=A0A0D3GH47_9ORYZ